MKRFNVVLLASWYPSPSNPLAGIFVKEQVEALSEKIPCANFFVVNWGQGEHELSLRRPGQSFVRLKRYLRQRDSKLSRTGDYFTVSVPALTWSGKLPFGGLGPLVKSVESAIRLIASQSGKMDLIHAHVCYPAGVVAAELSEKFGTPFVLTEHMSPFPFPSLLKHGKLPEQVSRAIQRASSVIAVSKHSAAQIVRCGFSSPIVIPNLVDERRFVQGKCCKGDFVFLTVGNLTRQKGIDILLRAIANWGNIPDNILFRIVGDGDEKEALISLANQLGTKNKVEWLGARARDALPGLFAESDCFVLPSRHESFGVVYAEAHACGKPVIATMCGGPEDIVTSENGLLVPIEDVDQLTKALQYMYRSARQYSPDAIRKTFITRYSRAAVVSQVSQVYEKVTGICLS